MLTLDHNGEILDVPIYNDKYPCIGLYVGMTATVSLRKADNINYSVEVQKGIYSETEYFTLTKDQRNDLLIHVGKSSYLEKYNQFQKELEARVNRHYKSQINKAQ